MSYKFKYTLLLLSVQCT